jgi:hypothetical protein
MSPAKPAQPPKPPPLPQDAELEALTTALAELPDAAARLRYLRAAATLERGYALLAEAEQPHPPRPPRPDFTPPGTREPVRALIRRSITPSTPLSIAAIKAAVQAQRPELAPQTINAEVKRMKDRGILVYEPDPDLPEASRGGVYRLATERPAPRTQPRRQPGKPHPQR